MKTILEQGKYPIIALMLITLMSGCAPSKTLTLNDAWHVIKEKKFVDLTHAFSPGIPHWKGFSDEKLENLYFGVKKYCH